MDSVRQWVEEGKKHFWSKNYLRAEQSFLKVLRAGARYADLLNMLGIIYHADGKFNDAIASFEEALKINPNYAEAILNLAILYNDLGEYKKARALYQRVHRGKVPIKGINMIMKGKLANMHASIADSYSGIGLLSEAIDEYKKALQLCPAYKDIRTKLGVCYRDNDQKSQAIKELEETVRKFPDYAPARIQLGVTYYSHGDYGKAEKEWTLALKREPRNNTVKMYLKLCESRKKVSRGH